VLTGAVLELNLLRPVTARARPQGVFRQKHACFNTRRKKMKKSLLWALVIIFCLASHGLAQEKPADGKAEGQEDTGLKEEHHGKSADELAKELTNPNNSIAKLTFKNQFRWYTGDLPDADDQSNYTLLFQPVFPFKLPDTKNGNKAVLFVRPAIPMLFDQPVPTVDKNGFDWDGVTAMGDIVTDLAYGETSKTGLIWAVGVVSTLPTATDSKVAGKQLRLGPEAVLAKISKKGIIGLFPSHQWDVTGWGDTSSYSTTSCQFFLTATPGGGWAVGTQPTLSYDWETYQWTIPLHLTVSKTVILGKMPFKFETELNYYVEQPDAFGPEWLVSFNVTPIVPNFIANWISGK